MIAPAKAGTKHIILFSDAADAEEPGDYKPLVAKCAKAGITDQRRRPGHGEGLRRRTAQGHRPAGRRPVHVHQRGPGAAPPVRPGHLRHRPQRVPGRPGGRPRDRRAGGHHAAGPGRFSPHRRIQPVLPAAGRESGRRLRRRVPGAGPGRLAGRPGTRAVLYGRGRRKVYRRDGRLEERRRLLHLAGPLDGRQVAESSAGAWWPRKSCETASAASSCTSTLPGRRTPSRACRN